MTEKTFANGLIVKRNEKAPDFVICNLAINIAEFAQFIKDNRNGDWMNIDVKLGRSGNYYAELNTWKPDAKQSQPLADAGSEQSGDLPF